MKVYVILDYSKDSYDAGGLYYGVFSSRGAAEDELSKFEPYDRSFFEIVEVDI